MARRLFGEHEFVEVFVDVPLAVAEQRDPKGLYKKARSQQLKNFTGVDSAYEPPDNPTLHLQADREDAKVLAARIMETVLAL